MNLTPSAMVLAGALALLALPAAAAPVTIDFTVTATSGAQFGVSAPNAFSGSFVVDSGFLDRADGTYPAAGLFSGFFIQVGSQAFDQDTAFNPNVQGFVLRNHEIVGMGMNWSQTSAGLRGPYFQMAPDGMWETGSTVMQPGEAILRGARGSVSFDIREVAQAVPEPTTVALVAVALVGAAGVPRRRRQLGSSTPVATPA